LFLSGDLLLATDCTADPYIGKEGRLLLARRVSDGKEAFRVQLPVKNFYPLPIREVAGLYLVTTYEFFGPASALLIDRKGNVWHQFDDEVIDAIQTNNGRAAVTSKDIIGLTTEGQIQWTTPFPYPEGMPGGGIISLPDNTLLAFIYCSASDDGVQLIRCKPDDGAIIWQAKCEGLGVAHSKYFQDVTVTADDHTVNVKSIGSFGTFLETLDLASGKQISRQSPAPGFPQSP
jgi:hypothetical protein